MTNEQTKAVFTARLIPGYSLQEIVSGGRVNYTFQCNECGIQVDCCGLWASYPSYVKHKRGCTQYSSR